MTDAKRTQWPNHYSRRQYLSDLQTYFHERDRERRQRRERRDAWAQVVLILAALVGLIALLERVL